MLQNRKSVLRKNEATTEKELRNSCIEEYFDSVRWAAFVLDLEAVVSEFNSALLWDHKSFLAIVETRNIIQLHRCAFYPSQVLGNDRKLNSIAFERVERLLLNTAKDIWLEPVYPINESAKLIHLKRNVTGLYLLHYLWITQGQDDNYKILVSFTPTDQTRLGVFHDRLRKLYCGIPNWTEVGKCIVYIIESLKARHAFQFTFRSDEVRLDREYRQLARVKNSSNIRETIMSIHANQHYESLLMWLESLCRKMSTILCEAEKATQVPVAMSLLLRSFLPLNVIRNCVLFEPENFKPVMLKLPGNYVSFAEQIIQLVLQSYTVIQRPFLTMDALVQLHQVSKKMQAFGKARTKARENKYSSQQKQLSDNVKAFNQKCIEANRLDKIVQESTRPYREMESFAWDFIHQRWGSNAQKVDEQKSKLGCTVSRNDMQSQMIDNNTLQMTSTTEFDEQNVIMSIMKEENETKFGFCNNDDAGPSTSFVMMELDEDEKRIQSRISEIAPLLALESTKTLKELL